MPPPLCNVLLTHEISGAISNKNNCRRNGAKNEMAPLTIFLLPTKTLQSIMSVAHFELPRQGLGYKLIKKMPMTPP